MKREVKCDRKANSCYLSPVIAPNVQFGRGGIVPLGTTYLIPLESLTKSKKQTGRGVHKAKNSKKNPVSNKKPVAKSRAKKEKQ